MNVTFLIMETICCPEKGMLGHTEREPKHILQNTKRKWDLV